MEQKIKYKYVIVTILLVLMITLTTFVRAEEYVNGLGTGARNVEFYVYKEDVQLENGRFSPHYIDGRLLFCIQGHAYFNATLSKNDLDVTKSNEYCTECQANEPNQKENDYHSYRITILMNS